MGYEKILENIRKKAAKINRPLRFMELCGTHAEAIARHNIKSVLPKNIQLVSGPGCPVCVTDQEDIDVIVGLAKAGIPVACYGDAAGVSGNLGSLEEARRNGADVRIIYDVSEVETPAYRTGRHCNAFLRTRKKTIIFWGIGFETTAPATAWAVKNGMTVFSSHKIFPPAMEILLKNKKNKIDGFIDPGHVSAIIGTKSYEKFKIPQVVAGFEASDVLLAVDMLLDQIISGEYKVQNEYARLVKKGGNKKALELIKSTFDIIDSKWRGLGTIRRSGLKLKKKYQKQDAEFIYKDLILKIRENIKTKPSACRCGEVLQGLIESTDCPLFGKVCNPDNPQGACMVSTEGGCNIEYRYEK
ncbi:MAG: Hydrogenase formation protein HypD [Patescibacteria group bacterium]|nr:Hydrogenase formation protein HypD [Patescibacteria group bacterium]